MSTLSFYCAVTGIDALPPTESGLWEVLWESESSWLFLVNFLLLEQLSTKQVNLCHINWKMTLDNFFMHWVKRILSTVSQWPMQIWLCGKLLSTPIRLSTQWVIKGLIDAINCLFRITSIKGLQIFSTTAKPLFRIFGFCTVWSQGHHSWFSALWICTWHEKYSVDWSAYQS